MLAGAVGVVPDAWLWLLPALFVVHDAEEALLLPAWLRRNREDLERRFPRLSRRLLPHLVRITPATFLFMAAEELFLLLAATCWAAFGGSYYPWLALLVAFGLHLVVHAVQALVAGRYVPAVATAVPCLAGCGWVIGQLAGFFTLREWVLCGVVGCVVAAANLWLLHRAEARRFRAG